MRRRFRGSVFGTVTVGVVRMRPVAADSTAPRAGAGSSGFAAAMCTPAPAAAVCASARAAAVRASARASALRAAALAAIAAVMLATAPAAAQSNLSGSLPMNANRSLPPESSAGAASASGIPSESTTSIRDEHARALIERHVAWLGGWPRLDSLQSLTISGRLAVAGLEGTITMRERRDGYRRTDFDLAVVKGSDAVGPNDAWSLNASGQ